MKSFGIFLASLFTFFLLTFGVMMMIPSTRALINEYIFTIEQVDQETDYENRRMVEDTARAMISNYNARLLEYNQYKDFANDTQEYTRALDAKTAANNIASAYNNYLTQNSFVFAGNLPDDIPYALAYIQ